MDMHTPKPALQDLVSSLIKSRFVCCKEATYLTIKHALMPSIYSTSWLLILTVHDFPLR